MFFKKNQDRTPQEKAQKAKVSIMVRLGACAYLIYLMIQMLQPQPDGPRSQTMIIVAIVMLVLSAVVIVLTLVDLYQAFKRGVWNPATYEDPTDETTAEALPESETDSPHADAPVAAATETDDTKTETQE